MVSLSILVQCEVSMINMLNPISRNCATTVLTVKPHVITSTKLYRQGIAPGSQYSDPAPEAAMLY